MKEQKWLATLETLGQICVRDSVNLYAKQLMTE